MLHDGSQFAFVFMAQSITLKEKYEVLKYLLEKVSCNQYEQFICVDPKMVNFLLGKQSKFTKQPCLLSTQQLTYYYHYLTLQKGLTNEGRISALQNKKHHHQSLVYRSKILLQSLQIKFVLIKQFTKALEKDDGSFIYWCRAFPGEIIENLIAAIFDTFIIGSLEIQRKNQ